MARNAPKAEKSEKFTITFPDTGRLINHSLFVLDAYQGKSGKPGKPAYRAEVAFDMDKAFDAVIEKMYDFADSQGWSDQLKFDLDYPEALPRKHIISGIKFGDDMAAKRADKGKPGDAYKGKWVVRAKTIFDRNGVEGGTGGAVVYDEAVELIVPANQGIIYPGCYVQMVCSLNPYVDDDSGNDAISFYLTAVQKTNDGEKLVSMADHSSLFQKRAGAAAAAGGGERRSRRG
jgi:hypothetical protein